MKLVLPNNNVFAVAILLLPLIFINQVIYIASLSIFPLLLAPALWLLESGVIRGFWQGSFYVFYAVYTTTLVTALIAFVRLTRFGRAHRFVRLLLIAQLIYFTLAGVGSFLFYEEYFKALWGWSLSILFLFSEY